MDFACYAYNWLIPELYPYYSKVVRLHPDRDVYLIEDNSGAHTKARQHLADHPLQEGVKFAPQPGNSPDLHPIERVFDILKDCTDSYEPTSGSEEEKLGATE